MARVRKGRTMHVGELTLLRLWFDLWASKTIDLKKLLERASKTHLDSQDIASELLDWGKIRPTANTIIEQSACVHPDRAEYFDRRSAQNALKLFDEMLVLPTTRRGALSCLWTEVPALHNVWIEGFVSKLSARSCSSVLLFLPSPDAQDKADHKFNALVGQYVPQNARLEITEMAVKAKKIPLLYALTGWQECQALSKKSEHDKLLELDLGL